MLPQLLGSSIQILPFPPYFPPTKLPRSDNNVVRLQTKLNVILEQNVAITPELNSVLISPKKVARKNAWSTVAPLVRIAIYHSQNVKNNGKVKHSATNEWAHRE